MHRSQFKRLSPLLLFALVLALAACDALPYFTASDVQATATFQAESTRIAKALMPYDEKADPHKDIADAFAKAKQDSKYVLLDFGANWCLDCRVLSMYYEKEPIKSFLAQNYHLVTIDVGQWDRNLDVANQYGNPIEQGIPAVVILDKDGKMITATNAGELANARAMSQGQIYEFLRKWAPNHG
jgi:protein disulfide-isomerase